MGYSKNATVYAPHINYLGLFVMYKNWKIMYLSWLIKELQLCSLLCLLWKELHFFRITNTSLPITTLQGIQNSHNQTFEIPS